MKVTIINGNTRHGSTWHSAQVMLQALEQYDTVEKTEFLLPRDMPHFCAGCFSCFYKGEQTCPHAQSVQPIARAILDADVVILTSPVYAVDVTGQMKALLDHLCYMWMSHRPDPRMFGKVGVAVATTAGAGLGHTVKTLRKSLTFWGSARVLSFAHTVSAMKWDDVSEKKRERIQKDAAKAAKRIAEFVRQKGRIRAPLSRCLLMSIMKGMMSKNTWNLRDRKHWEEQGWIKAAALSTEPESR